MSQQILRIDGVMAKTGLAKSTIYLRLKQDPHFPRPVPLGSPHAVGWLASELDEWISSQVRASRGEPVAA
ncbi:MAG: AlpA family phage regulatory protein [Gemmatimonadota bacterium]|nr:AlpA family phage regulatory protein [Gemmatimonadota bacterium]